MNTGIAQSAIEAQSIMELKQAEQNFNYAAPEFVEIAIMHLLAANLKVNMLFKLRKQNNPL